MFIKHIIKCSNAAMLKVYVLLFIYKVIDSQYVNNSINKITVFKRVSLEKAFHKIDNEMASEHNETCSIS